MLVLAPFGGVLADRLERRNLILLAQSAVLTSELAILSLLLLGELRFWHLVAATALMGSAFPLIMPARQAIVVNIVGKRGLGSAMALNMTGVNVTRVVGPAAAGFLIPLLGVEGVYSLDVALYYRDIEVITRRGGGLMSGPGLEVNGLTMKFHTRSMREAFAEAIMQAVTAFRGEPPRLEQGD